MDQVYRIYQKGQEPQTGEIVTALKLKSIITQPVDGDRLPAGSITVLGAAYSGETDVESVEVSVDNGKTWDTVEFIGPHEMFSWRQWQYVLAVEEKGSYTLMSRATDTQGHQQPMNAKWNVLGYGNNGVREHAVTVQIT